MTKVIANILINEVLNTAEYDAEKKISLIKEVEKMLKDSIKMEMKYKQEEKIVKNDTDVTIEPQKVQSNENNKTEVTPTEVTPPVEENKVEEKQVEEKHPVVEVKKQDTIPTRPTKKISNDDNKISNAEKTMSFKEKVASLALLAEESKKPDNRTYEEKVQGMKDFFDPTDPEGKKAEKLMDKAQELLGYDEYETMRNAFNKPETFQRLCNLWDYFHREIPDNWPERPNID